MSESDAPAAARGVVAVAGALAVDCPAGREAVAGVVRSLGLGDGPAKAKAKVNTATILNTFPFKNF